MIFDRLKRALKGQAQQDPRPQPAAADIAASLRVAVGHHQSGELAQAEVLYREILAKAPTTFDALHLMGVVQHQTGRHEAAVEFIRAALAVNPNEAAAWSNLGLALRGLGRSDEALLNYDRALLLSPDYVDALLNRAGVLQDQRRLDEALASCDRAVGLRPESARAHSTRGDVLVALRRHNDAVESFDRALALDPAHADTLNNRGDALWKLERHEEALASLDGALALRPRYPEALNNRGNVLREMKRPLEALAGYDRAIELKRGYAAALLNRGNVLEDLGRPVDALASFDRALVLEPESAEAHSNRANALLALGRPKDALASFDRAQALAPENPVIRYNESLCRLLTGDFAAGWRGYEFRWHDAQLAAIARNFGEPLWLGDANIAGRTVLLHAEQGFGDTLQFCRYAGLTAARGAIVVLEVQAPLKPLLHGMRGVRQVLAKGEALPPFDYHCPMLSLPLAFDTRLESIPAGIPYLAADAAKVSQWQARLGAPTRPRIGLAWSGSTTHRNDRNRSVPLADIARCIDSGNQYVSLQKELRMADQEVLAACRNILHFGEGLHDFSDTAALVALMDLVITADTSVAHLAGAMGKPVWILLPFNPDWRWLLERIDSPWYPTARLFRQPAIGDWDSVIKRVATELKERAFG